MKVTSFITIILSGVCTLPACAPRKYILVGEERNWTHAQQYCRERYNDLATVETEEDFTKLNELIAYDNVTWIGLQTNFDTWRWSPRTEARREGGLNSSLWKQNVSIISYRLCVATDIIREWKAFPCSQEKPFICYNASTEPEKPPRFIFVNETKIWSEAQRYCMETYTDLASVRNLAEKEEVRNEIRSRSSWTWIGLYKDPWEWSDGSYYSLGSLWTWIGLYKDPRELSNGSYYAVIKEIMQPLETAITMRPLSCVLSYRRRWFGHNCSDLHPFACNFDPKNVTQKQVVRLVLTKSNSSVDLETLKESILQKLNQKLEDRGLSKDIKLSWVTQSDGKVFHQKEEKKEVEEESCPAA